MGSGKLPKESRVKMISIFRKNLKKEEGGIIRHIQVVVEVKRKRKG
jgi:hypothetical protein